MPLKQFLLDTLSSLPGARTLHLYTIIASPTRDKELFVYAPVRPKIHVRHHLILLAQHAPDKPAERVFVCAIEAFLYSIPSTSSAILYISKVDSSGQADIRPNPTRALVTAFLEYYSSPNNRPAPNLWIHVFARAQNQYLFPNSAEHPGKRVLRDISLCKWWKDVIEQVAMKNDPSWVRLYYLLPGYSSVEATAALNKSFSSTPGYPWTYSHPYHQTDVCPPCGGPIEQDAQLSIAQLIPSFPDDPKARFLDEIASTPSEAPDALPKVPPTSPSRPQKRFRANPEPEIDSSSASSSTSPNKSRSNKSVSPAAQRALAAVPIDEFWERIAYRQECSQGAITGFFAALFTSPNSTRNLPIVSHFYEPALPPSPPGELPLLLLERIITMLMNLDFGTTERARRATGVLEDAIRGLCDKGSSFVQQQQSQPRESSLADTSVMDDMAETTNVGGSGASASFEEYIYGCVILDNPPLPSVSVLSVGSGGIGSGGSEERPVTILQVRKKKRPAAPS